MTRPLADSQKKILVALLEHEASSLTAPALTPNDIGSRVGARVVVGGRGMNGRGRGHRVFGRAQAIIPALNGLSRRGLIRWVMRDDGLSGRAVTLTSEGETEALRVRYE